MKKITIFKPIGLFFLISLSLPGFALADDWSSGGGGIPQGEHNPWFLKNTEEVTYCINISDDFGPDKKTAQHIIEHSFVWWKNEFEAADHTDVAISVGTQTFTYQESCKNPDITFQLGTLDEQQKKYGDFSKFVGRTVRTNYNSINLKGKGFIYVASESTLLKNKSIKDVLPNIWTFEEGGLLQKVLVHELGHVFGFSHYKGSSIGHRLQTCHFSNYPDVMDEYYPFAVVTGSDFFGNGKGPDCGEGKLDTIQEIFRHKQINITIYVPERISDHPDFIALGLGGYQALHIEQDNENEKTYKIQVKGKSSDEIWIEAGNIIFTHNFSEYLNPIAIYLPAEQTVYDSSSLNQKEFVFGPRYVRKTKFGYFHNALTNEKYPVHGEFTNQFARILYPLKGAKDGDLGVLSN